jgi:hypothetical protein
MVGTLNPGGFCVAVTYLVIVVVVFSATALTTKPSNVGYDWIPFILLDAPWYWMSPKMLLPGLVANTIFMYVFGSGLYRVYAWAARRSL